MANVLPKTFDETQPQITIRSYGPSGVKVRADAVGKDKLTGDMTVIDMKASDTAPFSPNQTVGYPEVGQYGGVIVGKGKPPYVGGIELPPRPVRIIRKSGP